MELHERYSLRRYTSTSVYRVFFGLDSSHTISVPANASDYLELQANGCRETVQT